MGWFVGDVSRDGFYQLYAKIPGVKPSLRGFGAGGGNPRMPRRLYTAGWRFDVVLGQLVEEKGVDRFVEGLSAKERRRLRIPMYLGSSHEDRVRRLLDARGELHNCVAQEEALPLA